MHAAHSPTANGRILTALAALLTVSDALPLLEVTILVARTGRRPRDVRNCGECVHMNFREPHAAHCKAFIGAREPQYAQVRCETFAMGGNGGGTCPQS